MTNKEREILNFMAMLNIDRAEAEQLYKDDHSDTMTVEQAELTAKAKQNYKHYERSEKVMNRTTTKREQKLDDNKVALLEYIESFLKDNYTNVTIVNPNREITLQMEDGEYSITLTKHRAKKN